MRYQYTGRYLVILPLVGFMLLSAGLATAGVYRWVDESGRVHFGDRPPVREAEEVEVHEQNPASGEVADDAAVEMKRKEKQRRMLDMYQEEREAKKQAKSKEKAMKKQRATRCTYARNRLKTYQRAALYEPTADGGRRYLSDGERDREIAEAKSAVKHWCD
ncbi:MAG: DUF4124 domain-containing protein [Candidatus Sedimenticola sp. 20ELBAFRAG]